MTHENISTAQNMEQTGKVGRRHGEAEESETTESAGIDECSIRDRICDVSGKKVMLDVEPGEIYGDETKNVNRQVKNNAGQLAIRLCFGLREMKQKNDRGAKYSPRYNEV